MLVFIVDRDALANGLSPSPLGEFGLDGGELAVYAAVLNCEEGKDRVM